MAYWLDPSLLGELEQVLWRGTAVGARMYGKERPWSKPSRYLPVELSDQLQSSDLCGSR
jgi:hypothetical protein